MLDGSGTISNELADYCLEVALALLQRKASGFHKF